MDGLYITDMTTFSLILMRMTGMLFLNPIFGRSNVPRLMRAGMVLSISVLVYMYAGAKAPVVTAFPEYVLLLIREFLLGFAIGLIVNMFIYIVLLAGEEIDMQMGLSMSSVYDPGSNISVSSSGTFYNIMWIMMFFTTNSHLTMMRIFIDYSQIVPYGSVVLGQDLSQHMLDLFCQCTVLGVKMALPILFLELMVEFAVGAMMKAVPQIDVFTVNIQLKLFLGLVFIYLTFQPMSDFLENVITQMFSGINLIFRLAGG